MSATFSKIDSLSQNDIDKIAGLLDKTFTDRLAPLATKDDLKETEDRIKVELKDYIHEGVETVMEGIDNITEKLADKDRVDRLERWIEKIGEKVGIKSDR